MDLHGNGDKHPHSREPRSGNDLHSDQLGRTVPVLGVLSWARSIAGNVHRKNDNRHKRNGHAKRLYAVVAAGAMALAPLPSKAENPPSVTAIASPQATSSGSVTNQAVQVLQGPYTTNTYGSGVQCQGPTLNFTPFISQSYNGTWGDGSPASTFAISPGASMTISIPLDESFKTFARTQHATWRREVRSRQTRQDWTSS